MARLASLLNRKACLITFRTLSGIDPGFVGLKMYIVVGYIYNIVGFNNTNYKNKIAQVLLRDWKGLCAREGPLSFISFLVNLPLAIMMLVLLVH